MKTLISILALIASTFAYGQYGIVHTDPKSKSMPFGQPFVFTGDNYQNKLYYLAPNDLCIKYLNRIFDFYEDVRLSEPMEEKDGDLLWFLENEAGNDANITYSPTLPEVDFGMVVIETVEKSMSKE